MPEAVSPGHEQNILAVGSPAENIFVSGMVGETPGLAAGGGDDVDIDVAVIFAAECDLGSVGRKEGIGFGADAGGQAASIAAIAAYDPEIAAVVEDDLRLAECGIAQEQRRIGLGRGIELEQKGKNQNEGEREHLAHGGSWDEAKSYCGDGMEVK